MSEQREIKFRAWHKKARKMFPVIGWMQGDYGPDDSCVYAIDEHGVTVRMADGLVELLQFTGLQDKNERDIYEGDIIEFSIFPEPEQEAKRIRDTVVWKHGCFGLGKRIELLGGMPSYRGIEVIGNVHEHPELLKGKPK